MGGVGAGNWAPPSSSSINSTPSIKQVLPLAVADHQPKLMYPARPVTVRASSNQSSPMVQKKKMKPRLMSISSSDGKWRGKWNSDYIFSLQDLQLHHLLDDEAADTSVFINLCIQKHAGLGLSVEGKIATCFMTKCCNCCSPYLRQINTTFNVWILQSTRTTKDSSHQLPDIGGDDPSVIYVKPGYKADLDSLIQDSIRLATSVKETCSESCEKSEPKLHHLGARNTASIEKRWYKLLELKKKQHDFRET
ncbi:hypothetical protein ACS0TY_011248 [Phlomoides rotata]